KDEVFGKLENIGPTLELKQYGALPLDGDKYPLYLLVSAEYSKDKQTVLVTGGVHGYETSGVQGAVRFAEQVVQHYLDKFNFIIAPCISPWSYETINRWNPNTLDPNRSFTKNSPSEEAALVMAAVFELSTDILAHFDLHETTDTDNTVFRPALEQRDAIAQDNWDIPDGFYLVGDSESPNREFQQAIIRSVEKVTHIAPPDKDGKIIGGLLAQKGVINYDTKKLGLCSGFSNCQYGTTTEVYPDSQLLTDEDCVKAQVAAIVGGLDYLVSIS
ncbi:MAG: M14 family metallocarboxypeptidase, partial [Kangiellaceae bacterium]|nr:M14 family metallocarboxypeptidase [Kangiellaceae bacterium]